MPHQSLEQRVAILEEQMQALMALPARVDALAAQMSAEMQQCRDELRTEIRGVREELLGEIWGLRVEMHAIRDELRGEMHAIRDELRIEMYAIRDELRNDIAEGVRETQNLVRVMYEQARQDTVNAIATALEPVHRALAVLLQRSAT